MRLDEETIRKSVTVRKIYRDIPDYYETRKETFLKSLIPEVGMSQPVMPIFLAGIAWLLYSGDLVQFIFLLMVLTGGYALFCFALSYFYRVISRRVMDVIMIFFVALCLLGAAMLRVF